MCDFLYVCLDKLASRRTLTIPVPMLDILASWWSICTPYCNVAVLRGTDNGSCHFHCMVQAALCGAGVCLCLFLALDVVYLPIYAKLGTVWVQAQQNGHHVYRQKESIFWNLRLNEQTGQLRKQWQSIVTLMGSRNKKGPAKDSDHTTATRLFQREDSQFVDQQVAILLSHP